MCGATEHRGEGKSPSFCDLEVWHSPVIPEVSDRFSYIGGHRFTCSHVNSDGFQHHVFVLDCSGFMRGEPWQHLVRGYREYLKVRLAHGATQDVVSIITFGNEGVIEYEGARIDHAVTYCIPFRGGGTFYSNGLNKANAIISRIDFNRFKPVMIFFTDGRPADRKKGPALATDIKAIRATRYADVCRGLWASKL